MAGDRRSRLPWLQALLLALAAAFAYLPTLRGGFLYDDVAIRDTGFFRDPWGVARSGFWDPRGLHNVAVALDVTLWGEKPAGFHLTNLALHVAAVLAAFWAGRLLLDGLSWGAFLGALLFALHPLQGAAVSYVIQRSEVMAGLFAFLTLGCYLNGRRGAATGRARPAWSWASLALIAILAGQFSKDNAGIIPALILITELLLRGRKAPWPWILSTLGALLLSAGILVVAFHQELFLGLLGTLLKPSSAPNSPAPVGAGGDWGISHAISPGIYFVTEMGVVARYLRLFFLPFGQRLDYAWGLDRDPLSPRPLMGLLGTLLLLAAAWRVRRSFPLALWGMAWFLLALAPTSSVVPIDDVIMEHRAYTALWGPALAAGAWAVGRGRRLAVPLACLALLTTARNLDWAVPERIWGESIRLNPRRSRAWEAWGGTLGSLGAPGLARALAADPRNYRAAHNLGRIRSEEGRQEEAVALFRQGIEAFPDADTILDLSASLWKLGRDAEAVPILRRARALYPLSAMLTYNEGTALLRLERPAEAVEPLARAVALGEDPQRPQPLRMPSNPRLWLAEALGRTKRPEEARRAVEPLLSSPDPTTRTNAWKIYRKACVVMGDAEGIRRADGALR